jgi:ArsR family transcriptional regulator
VRVEIILLIIISGCAKKALTKIGSGIIFRIMSKYRDKNIQEFAEMFKALSNPNRLKIFLRLVSCCPSGTPTSISRNLESEGCACVGELGQDLGIVPSTISHHIKELRRAGLIRMERRGQKIECWIDPETIAALQGFFS